MSVQQAPLCPYSQDARPEASPVSLAWCLAAWALVTQSTIVAIQALAAITFAVSMPTAEFSLRTDTAVHVPTALTCSARAIGITVTYSTLAAAKAWGRAMHRVITILTHNWLSHTTHALNPSQVCLTHPPIHTPEYLALALNAMRLPELKCPWEGPSDPTLCQKLQVPPQRMPSCRSQLASSHSHRRPELCPLQLHRPHWHRPFPLHRGPVPLGARHPDSRSGEDSSASEHSQSRPRRPGAQLEGEVKRRVGSESWTIPDFFPRIL